MAGRPIPILLTGAGFTHNFGGYLARDMWAQIFNHEAVQRCDSVRRAMRKNFNFETVYDEILYGSFNPDEKKAIIEGLKSAFADLDEIVRGVDHRGGQASDELADLSNNSWRVGMRGKLAHRRDRAYERSELGIVFPVCGCLRRVVATPYLDGRQACYRVVAEDQAVVAFRCEDRMRLERGWVVGIERQFDDSA